MGNTIPTAQAPLVDVNATLQEELPQLAVEASMGRGKFMKSLKCPSTEGGSALVKVYALPSHESLETTRQRFASALQGKALAENAVGGSLNDIKGSRTESRGVSFKDSPGPSVKGSSVALKKHSKSASILKTDHAETGLSASVGTKSSSSRFGDSLAAEQGSNSDTTSSYLLNYGPWSSQFVEACSRIHMLSKTFTLAKQPNVLPYQFYSVGRKHSVVIIARQFMSSTLHDRLHTRPFLTSIEKRWVAYQLLCTLVQCHSEGVCHGDIKTENIGMTSWGWLLLTDFAPFKPAYLPEDHPADFDYFFDPGARRRCYLAPERFLGIDKSQKKSTGGIPDKRMAELQEENSPEHAEDKRYVGGQLLLGTAMDGGFQSLNALLEAVTGASEAFECATNLGSEKLADKSDSTPHTTNKGQNKNCNIWPGPSGASDPYMLPSMDVFSAGCCIGELFMEGKSVCNLENLLRYRREDTAKEGDSEDSPVYSVKRTVNDKFVVDLVSHMTQKSPSKRASALVYIQRYTGADNFFPPSFVSCLFPFFSALMQPALMSPDSRVTAVCEAYAWLLAEITGTSDPVGELYFKKRLALERYATVERTQLASDDMSWANEENMQTPIDGGVIDESMRNAHDNAVWEWLDNQETCFGKETGFEASARSWLSHATPWGLYEEWYPATVSTSRLRQLRQSVGSKYLTARNSQNGTPNGENENDVQPGDYSDNESQGSSHPSPVSNGFPTSKKDGILIPAPKAHAEAVTMIIVLLCSAVRHVTSPRLRVTALTLLGRFGSMKCTSDEVRLQRIIPYAVDLFWDGSGLVRSHAVMIVATMLQQVKSFPPSDAGIVLKYIIPALNSLPNDPEPVVRAACASAIPRISSAARNFVETEQWSEQLAALERLDPETGDMSKQKQNDVEQQSSSETSISVINGPADEENSRTPGDVSPSKNLRFRYSFEYRLRELQLRMNTLLNTWMTSFNVNQGNEPTITTSNNKIEKGYQDAGNCGTCSTSFGPLNATPQAGVSGRNNAILPREYQNTLNNLAQQATTVMLTAANSAFASSTLVEHAKARADFIRFHRHASSTAFGAWARFSKTISKLPSLYYSAFCRHSMLRSLPLLCHSFGRELVEEVILPLIFNIYDGGKNSGDWRTHSEFYLALPGLAAFVGKTSTEYLFQSILEEGPYDAAPQVSHSALTALASIVQQQLISTASVVNMLSDSETKNSGSEVGPMGFLVHPSYWVRRAFSRLLATVIVELHWPDAHAYIAPLLSPLISAPHMLSGDKEMARRIEIRFWNKIHQVLDKLTKDYTSENPEGAVPTTHRLQQFSHEHIVNSRRDAWAIYQIQNIVLSAVIPPIQQGAFALSVCFNLSKTRNDILEPLSAELKTGGVDVNFGDLLLNSDSLSAMLENPSISEPSVWFPGKIVDSARSIQASDFSSKHYTKYALHGFSSLMDLLRYQTRAVAYLTRRIAHFCKVTWRCRYSAEVVQLFRNSLLSKRTVSAGLQTANPNVVELSMELRKILKTMSFMDLETAENCKNSAGKHPGLRLPYTKGSLRALSATNLYIPDQRYSSMFPRAPSSVMPRSDFGNSSGKVVTVGEEAAAELKFTSIERPKSHTNTVSRASSAWLKGLEGDNYLPYLPPNVFSTVTEDSPLIGSALVKNSGFGGMGTIQIASPPLLTDQHIYHPLLLSHSMRYAQYSRQTEINRVLYHSTMSSHMREGTSYDWGSFYMMQCFSSGVCARRNYLRYGLWDPNVTVSASTDAIMSAGAQPGAGDGLILCVRNSSSNSSADAVLRPSNSSVNEDPTLDAPNWEHMRRFQPEMLSATDDVLGVGEIESSENVWDIFEGSSKKICQMISGVDKNELCVRWPKESSARKGTRETSGNSSHAYSQSNRGQSSFGQPNPTYNTRREIITGPGQTMSAKRRDPMLTAARYASAACSAMIAVCTSDDREAHGLKDDLPDSVDSWMKFATGFGGSKDAVIKPPSYRTEHHSPEKDIQESRNLSTEESLYYLPNDGVFGMSNEQLQALLSAPRVTQQGWVQSLTERSEEEHKFRLDYGSHSTYDNAMNKGSRKEKEASFVADACIPLHGSIRHHQHGQNNEMTGGSLSSLIGIPTPGLAKYVSIRPEQVQRLLYKHYKSTSIQAFEDHFKLNDEASRKKTFGKSSRQLDSSSSSLSQQDVPSDLDFLPPMHLAALTRRIKALELPPLPPYLGFVRLGDSSSNSRRASLSEPRPKSSTALERDSDYFRPFISYFATVLAKARMQRSADNMETFGSTSILHHEGNPGNVASKNEDPIFGSYLDSEFVFVGEVSDEESHHRSQFIRCPHENRGNQQSGQNDPYFVPAGTNSRAGANKGVVLNFVNMLQSIFRRSRNPRAINWKDFYAGGINARSEHGRLYDLSSESKKIGSSSIVDPVYLNMIDPESSIFFTGNESFGSKLTLSLSPQMYFTSQIMLPPVPNVGDGSGYIGRGKGSFIGSTVGASGQYRPSRGNSGLNNLVPAKTSLLTRAHVGNETDREHRQAAKNTQTKGFSAISKAKSEMMDIWGSKPHGLLVCTLVEHTAAINQIAVVQDHSFFVSASDDGTCKVWPSENLGRGASVSCLATYDSQIGRITCVCLIENSTSVVSGSSDGTVDIWRVSLEEARKGNYKSTSEEHGGEEYGSTIESYLFGDGNSTLDGSGEERSKGNLGVSGGANPCRNIDYQSDNRSVYNPVVQTPGIYHIRRLYFPGEGGIVSVKEYTTASSLFIIVGTKRGRVHAYDLRLRKEVWKICIPLEFGCLTTLELFSGDNQSFADKSTSIAALVGTDRAVVAVYDLRFQLLVSAWRHSSRLPIEGIWPYLSQGVATELFSDVHAKFDGDNATTNVVRQLGAAVAAGDSDVGFWNLETGQCIRVLRVVSGELRELKSEDVLRAPFLSRIVTRGNSLGKSKNSCQDGDSQTGKIEIDCESDSVALERYLREELSDNRENTKYIVQSTAKCILFPLPGVSQRRLRGYKSLGSTAKEHGEDTWRSMGMVGEAQEGGGFTLHGMRGTGAMRVSSEAGAALGGHRKYTILQPTDSSVSESNDFESNKPATFIEHGSTGERGYWDDYEADLDTLPAWLLTAGTDRSVRCWDLRRPRASYTVIGLDPGQERHAYEGHPALPYSVLPNYDDPDNEAYPPQTRFPVHVDEDGFTTSERSSLGPSVPFMLLSNEPYADESESKEIPDEVEADGDDHVDENTEKENLPSLRLRGPVPPPTAHMDAVNTIEWLDFPDRLFVTGSRNGVIKVWK